jgi:hypothetical protein
VIVERGGLHISLRITASGRSPALVRWMFEAYTDPGTRQGRG